jgi:hypothetical protein
MNRLNAVAARWLDLAPEQLSRGRFDGQSVVCAFKVPVVPHAVTSATYTNISRTHFTWQGERREV